MESCPESSRDHFLLYWLYCMGGMLEEVGRALGMAKVSDVLFSRTCVVAL